MVGYCKLYVDYLDFIAKGEGGDGGEDCGSGAFFQVFFFVLPPRSVEGKAKTRQDSKTALYRQAV